MSLERLHGSGGASGVSGGRDGEDGLKDHSPPVLWDVSAAPGFQAQRVACLLYAPSFASDFCDRPKFLRLSMPLRLTKADIQENLLREYGNLGKPADNLTPQQLLDQTEILMSSALTFSVHEDDEGKQYISSSGQSRWLPEDKKYQAQIHRDKNNCPFITDGTTSAYCVTFFAEQAASNVPLPEAPSSKAAAAAPPLPMLPSSVEAPTSRLPGMSGTSLSGLAVWGSLVFWSLEMSWSWSLGLRKSTHAATCIPRSP